MPFLDGYDWDIFISYAHADDKDDAIRPQWVSHFRRLLELEVRQSLGQEIEVYFDRGDQQYNERIEELVAKVRSSALFVVVGSPSYTNSKWCQREAAAFVELHQDPRRIFMVEYIPPLSGAHYPEGLPNNLRASFWALDARTNTRITYERQSSKYRAILSKLAQQVAAVLDELRSESPTAAPEPAVGALTAGKTVFIAYGSDDVEDERMRVKDYLEDSGIAVLPSPFTRPGNTERYKKAVQEGLAQSQLFVQLLGARPCRQVEDLPDGDTFHQHAEAKNNKLKLVLWRSETLDTATIQNQRYRELIESEHVRACGIPELEKILVSDAKPKSKEPVRSRLPGKHFLVSADSGDADYADDLLKACRARQVSASRSTDIRSDLVAADIVTFVYGRVREAWLSSQFNMYRKARAMNDEISSMPLIVCIGPPESSKANLPFYEPGMLELDVRQKWTTQPFEDLLDDMIAS